MLEKPDLSDKLLIDCLHESYGLRVTQLDFLPLGADARAAVYRAIAGDGAAYFVKLRRGPFDEMSVAVPGFLGDQGIPRIIAPYRTSSGALWTRLEPYAITAYPFVAGVDAYEIEMSQQQWTDFGSVLRQIHAAPLPAALIDHLPRETYSPQWREQVRAYQARARDEIFEDAVAAELARFMRDQQAVIAELVEAAERLGQTLQREQHDLVLCHADIHAGNCHIAPDGTLYIVDWDTAVLAPKERDLMYPGSGLGRGWDSAESSDRFYQGYGPAQVDPNGIAYYRCERMVQDVAAFCEQLLDTTEGGQDRAQSLYYLTSSFRSDSIVDIALRSYETAERIGRR